MSDYPKDYIRYAQVHWQALQAYKPQPFSGHITLFRARKQPLLCLDPTLGWAALAQQGVAVNVIPGTHEKMLAEPNVQILAAELKLCLVEAQSPTAELAGAELEAEEEEPENRTARSGPCSIIT